MSSSDLFSQIMEWEDGEMSSEDEIKFFQHLVDTGLAWSLQGMYGRRAVELIGEGKVSNGAGADMEGDL